MKPLYMIAFPRRSGPPAYTRCPCNVFPAWTKKISNAWTARERKLPYCPSDGNLREYIAAFDEANNLKPAHHIPNADNQEQVAA